MVTSPQLSQCGLNLGLRLIQRFWGWVAVDVGKAEVAEAAGGEDVDVQVGHLQPGDDHSRALRFECPAHGLSDQLANRHDASEDRGIDVLPLIDLGARHHEGVALCHRLYRQERDDLVVLVHEAAGQFAVDDLGEDRRHALSICLAKSVPGGAWPRSVHSLDSGQLVYLAALPGIVIPATEFTEMQAVFVDLLPAAIMI